jgi:hypothetical protein
MWTLSTSIGDVLRPPVIARAPALWIETIWLVVLASPMVLFSVLSPRVVLPQFGSELWSGPKPPRTGLKFGLGFRVGAEPDRQSGSGFGVGPNLAEPFRTGSKPRTVAVSHCFGICRSQVSTPYCEQRATASGSASHLGRLPSCLYTLLQRALKLTQQIDCINFILYPVLQRKHADTVFPIAINTRVQYKCLHGHHMEFHSQMYYGTRQRVFDICSMKATGTKSLLYVLSPFFRPKTGHVIDTLPHAALAWHPVHPGLDSDGSEQLSCTGSFPRRQQRHLQVSQLPHHHLLPQPR